MSQILPDPALVVLVGASGSGKSAWAAARYRAAEVVSSDQLRAVVGSGEHDLDASADAFALLDQIVAARLKRGLTTVVDTLGLDPARRRAQLDLARQAGLPAVAVLFDTDPAVLPPPQRGAGPRRARRRTRRPAAADARAAGEVAAEGWDLVLRPAGAAIEPAHSPGSRRAAAEQDLRPARLELRPADLQVRRGKTTRPAGWPASPPRRPTRGLRRHRADGPPDPDPAGGPGLGADPRALGDARPAGRPAHRACAWARWSPRSRFARPESWRRPSPRSTCSPAAGRSAASARAGGIASTRRSGCRSRRGRGAAGPARDHHRDAAGTVAARHQALRGTRVTLPETTCYPRPVSHVPVIVGGGGERRTLRIAARLGDGCNLPAGPGRPRPQARGAPRALPRGGPGPGRGAGDRAGHPGHRRRPGHAAAIVEKLRGRTPAATFARRHHSGTAADHIGRYRLLAERGVSTVFVSLPDLAGPDDVLRLAPVTAAFR